MSLHGENSVHERVANTERLNVYTKFKQNLKQHETENDRVHKCRAVVMLTVKLILDWLGIIRAVGE